MTGADGFDRRRASRIPLDWGVPGRMDRGARVTLLDISHLGALLHVQAPLAAGESHAFTFPTLEGPTVTLTATVARSVPADSFFHDSFLVGAAFTSTLGDDEQASLDRLVACQRQPHCRDVLRRRLSRW